MANANIVIILNQMESLALAASWPTLFASIYKARLKSICIDLQWNKRVQRIDMARCTVARATIPWAAHRTHADADLTAGWSAQDNSKSGEPLSPIAWMTRLNQIKNATYIFILQKKERKEYKISLEWMRKKHAYMLFIEFAFKLHFSKF